MEKEEIESNQIEKVSNLFKTISISEYLESLNVEKSIDKQKADDLVIDEPTIAEDIDDYIDESNVENVLSIEEVDEKLHELRCYEQVIEEGIMSTRCYLVQIMKSHVLKMSRKN